MAGQHHGCTGHALGQTLGDGEGQGGLACCSPGGRKDSDATGRLNNNNIASYGRANDQTLAFLSLNSSVLFICKCSLKLNVNLKKEPILKSRSALTQHFNLSSSRAFELKKIFFPVNSEQKLFLLLLLVCLFFSKQCLINKFIQVFMEFRGELSLLL